jgi:N-glycosylase/DNA lyase
LDSEGWWAGPVLDKLIRIRRHGKGFEWETYPEEHDEALIIRYFRLDDDVAGIYSDLADRDEHMAALLRRYQGLRLVRQDPTETLLSYICSAANSVPRISRAIKELSRKYGRLIISVGGQEHYSFPSVQSLADADPDELAKTGPLAFRGRNLALVVQQLLTREPDWLNSLRFTSYEHAKSELLTLRGVGAKIADCVCLFSLDKDAAVPVDTHIRQVAARYFMPDLKTKTITPAAYDRIVRVFWTKFGRYAGWAQEYLYLEDLSRRRLRLSDEQETAQILTEHV